MLEDALTRRALLGLPSRRFCQLSAEWQVSVMTAVYERHDLHSGVGGWLPVPAVRDGERLAALPQLTWYTPFHTPPLGAGNRNGDQRRTQILRPRVCCPTQPKQKSRSWLSRLGIPMQLSAVYHEAQLAPPHAPPICRCHRAREGEKDPSCFMPRLFRTVASPASLLTILKPLAA